MIPLRGCWCLRRVLRTDFSTNLFFESVGGLQQRRELGKIRDGRGYTEAVFRCSKRYRLSLLICEPFPAHVSIFALGPQSARAVDLISTPKQD